MKVLNVRNVNEAIDELLRSIRNSEDRWVTRESRNGVVYELDRPMTTVYHKPLEKVSFSGRRDANPFFHLFESLWILAGRRDLSMLSLFNKRMANYSDDGKSFHAAYGYRLRRAFGIDQITSVVEMLKKDPNTRRCVMSIWNPSLDLDVDSKDLPCNDTIFFKTRFDSDILGHPQSETRLDMTVCCRSNDAIWGAYGANAVQFGTLLELVAHAAGFEVGDYYQISDSMHVYSDPSNEAFWRMMNGHDWNADLYQRDIVHPFPLMAGSDLPGFLQEVELFCLDTDIGSGSAAYHQPFLLEVGVPMREAWYAYKEAGADVAAEDLSGYDQSIDWIRAGTQWMERRAKPCLD